LFNRLIGITTAKPAAPIQKGEMAEYLLVPDEKVPGEENGTARKMGRG